MARVEEPAADTQPWLRALLGGAGPRPRDLAALVAILAVAAALRFWDITQPLVDVFSWREASTAMMADNFRTGGWNIFFPEVNWTGPGPSYQGREFQLLSYIVAILHAIFGWHDWFGRLVAALFGMVTVFALHRLTALIWDERHAHAAALSYALMPGAIIIDRSFLPDPAMLALVTLGLWLFLRHWVEGGGRMLVLGTAAFTLGALAKLPGLGAGLVVLWLVGVWLARGQLRRAGLTVLATAAGLVAIAGYYAWAVYLGNSYPPYHVAGSGYVWDYGLDTFIANGFYLEDLWFTAVWWFHGYPILLLIAVGLWMAPGWAAIGRDRALAVVPHVWLLGALIVYFAAAREITNNPWNLHILHVPLAIFCGRGLIVLVDMGRAATPAAASGVLRTGLVVLAVLLLSTLPLSQRLKDAQGEEARLMGRRLDALAGPDDLVIAVSPVVGDPIGVYYSRRRGWVFPPGGGDGDWSAFEEDDAAAIAQLEALRAQGARWFAVTRNAKDSRARLFFEHHAGVLDYLEANATRAADSSNYVIYRLDGGSGASPSSPERDMSQRFLK
ncbi:glycosyltransferase family 39 protein [Actibacterium sp. MT2.3-13A]|uniref:ArnT family glycosyltransferase n=1 Tax=Actibacterium sp. MT2.3-13A TaxID=2828332 RepID=UPI001BAC7BF1|nr:glycosyltransferase family 39 protein [Actibacterium sp. MT2.3-13A]